MTGRVENRRALLAVPLRFPNRPDLAVEFVVDTGFTDALCLTVPAVTALGLPTSSTSRPASPTAAASYWRFTRRPLFGTAKSSTFTFWRLATGLL